MSARNQIRQDAVDALATLNDEELIIISDAVIPYIFVFNDDGTNVMPGDWQQAPSDPLHVRLTDVQSAFVDGIEALISMDPADGRDSIRQNAYDKLVILDSDERSAALDSTLKRIFVSDPISRESLSNSWYNDYPNPSIVFWPSDLAVRDIYLSLFSLP